MVRLEREEKRIQREMKAQRQRKLKIWRKIEGETKNPRETERQEGRKGGKGGRRGEREEERESGGHTERHRSCGKVSVMERKGDRVKDRKAESIYRLSE